MGRAWVLIAMLLLAGCGGGGSNESKQGGAVVRTIRISEKEFSLTPSTVNLPKTGTYVFQAMNDGQITHALEIEGNGVEDRIADVPAGQTKTLRVNLSKEGSYEIYCPIDGHRDQGMKGKVVVGGAAGAGGSTSTGQTTTSGRPGY